MNVRVVICMLALSVASGFAYGNWSAQDKQHRGFAVGEHAGQRLTLVFSPKNNCEPFMYGSIPAKGSDIRRNDTRVFREVDVGLSVDGEPTPWITDVGILVGVRPATERIQINLKSLAPKAVLQRLRAGLLAEIHLEGRLLSMPLSGSAKAIKQAIMLCEKYRQ